MIFSFQSLFFLLVEIKSRTVHPSIGTEIDQEISRMSTPVILVTGGYDDNIRYWDATSEVCTRTVKFADLQLNCLQISQDKVLLAAGGNPLIHLILQGRTIMSTAVQLFVIIVVVALASTWSLLVSGPRRLNRLNGRLISQRQVQLTTSSDDNSPKSEVGSFDQVILCAMI